MLCCAKVNGEKESILLFLYEQNEEVTAFARWISRGGHSESKAQEMQMYQEGETLGLFEEKEVSVHGVDIQ